MNIYRVIRKYWQWNDGGGPSPGDGVIIDIIIGIFIFFLVVDVGEEE